CFELNHMLRCLCGSPSIPLSFMLAHVLPRRDTYCVNYGTERLIPPYTQHPSSSACTARVSWPPRLPRDRGFASVTVHQAPYAGLASPFVSSRRRPGTKASV